MKNPCTSLTCMFSNHFISIGLYGLLTLHYFGFITPFLWDYKVVMPIGTAIWITLTIFLAMSTYATTMIDPVDDAVNSKNRNKALEYGTQVSYCHACKVDVHSSSRHCRYCDKCVLGFDHHCSWYIIPHSHLNLSMNKA